MWLSSSAEATVGFSGREMAKLMIAAQARAYAGSAAGDARGALDVPTWHDVLAHKLGEHRQKVLMHGGAVAVR